MSRKKQRICDISGKTVQYFSVPTTERNDLKARFEFTRRKDPYLSKPTGIQVAFPKDTRGVFYYYQDPSYPPISGELRFRICDTPSRFKSGSDLDMNIGEPWNVPLYNLSKYPIWIGIRNLLIYEGLVDGSLVSDVAKLPLRAKHSKMLYKLNQPFIVDLDTRKLSVCLLTRQSLQTVRLTSMFGEQRHGRKTPYRGRFKARFEISNLPEHRSNPGLVLRFVEQLTPLECTIENYDGFMSPPRAGDLLTKKTKGGHPRPWYYPLDTRANGLKLKTFLGMQE